MGWKRIVPLVNTCIRCFGILRAIPFHVGRNDIGRYSTKSIIRHYKFAMYVVNQMLSTTSLLFSSILPRTSWRYSRNVTAMNNSRIRINRAIREYFNYNNCYVILHPDLEDCHPALFPDGTHLSFLGNDIFINIIQGALEQFILSPLVKLFPLV